MSPVEQAARPTRAFCGVLADEAAIFAAYFFTKVALLLYNVIGCVVVVLTGVLLSNLKRPSSKVCLSGGR